MREVIAIARNTFKEAIRNRILYFILIFALLIIGVSGVLSELSITSQMRVIKSLGFMSVNFFGVAIAVFVGVTLVYNELEKKSIYTIVSKPISRGHFILGKYIGLLMTVYVNVLLMTYFFLVALHFYQGSHEGGVLSALGASFGRAFVSFFAWNAYDVTANVMQVTLITCIELMIITAFSVLFSSFSTPTLSMMLTVMTFIAGRLNETSSSSANRSGATRSMRRVRRARWSRRALTCRSHSGSPVSRRTSCRTSGRSANARRTPSISRKSKSGGEPLFTGSSTLPACLGSPFSFSCGVTSNETRT